MKREFLHDDGILYAEKLRAAGIAVTLNETKGTMHGFDIVQKAPTTKAALGARIAFMKEYFAAEKQEIAEQQDENILHK